MLTHKATLLVTSLFLLLMSNFVSANVGASHETVQKNVADMSLKQVMQGLLLDTQQLTEAMLTEDFKVIAVKASKIANHPKPSIKVRKKVMKALATDMLKFKENDIVVHTAAVEIVNSAKQKNITGVGENFTKMIGGCVSCHRLFKNKVSAILTPTKS